MVVAAATLVVTPAVVQLLFRQVADATTAVVQLLSLQVVDVTMVVAQLLLAVNLARSASEFLTLAFWTEFVA